MKVGLVAGAALMIDYVLTPAVSLTAGVEAIASAFPALLPHRVAVTLFLLAVITLINLRGATEAGTVMAVPVYLFLFVYLGMIAVGLWKAWTEGSGALVVTATPAIEPLTVLVLMRALASGTTRSPTWASFEFEGGGKIPNLRMSFVTHGKLNAAKDNAIVFLHGFGSNHHGFDQMIGPGKPLDTDRYFVVCPDALGATQTGYEHSTSPTNSGLKMRFPAYSSRDMVKASHRLVTEALGIPHVLAITGLSMGAAHSVQFAVSHPQFMDGILPVVGGALWGTQGYFWLPQVLSTIERCTERHEHRVHTELGVTIVWRCFPLLKLHGFPA